MIENVDHFEEMRKARKVVETSANYARRIKRFKAYFEKEMNYPYDIKQVTAHIIHQFISIESVWSTGEKKGQIKSHSTPESNHAAIVDHFKENDCTLPINFENVSLRIQLV